MTNPVFVTWLAKGTAMSEGKLQFHMQRLSSTAQMSGDDQFKIDVGDYISAIGSQK